MTRPAAGPALARPFNFARLALAIVVPIIVYASLRPFHGWRDPGRALSSYLSWGREAVSTSDAILNVVGYLPFGLCLALALFPRQRGWRAFAIAAIGPAAFSVLVETLQLYLPGRMPSLVDVTMNVLGATAGAALAALCTPWLADHRGGRQLRARWLAPGHLTEGGLMLLAAWFVALFAQRTLLFGAGDWRGNLQAVVEPSVPAALYFGTEVFVVAANFVVAAVVLRLVLAEGAPRLRWLLALVGSALVLRVVAQLAFWPPAAVWRWITPAGTAGLVLGAVFAARWVMVAPRRAAALGAIGLMLAAVIVVNATPPDPALWLRPGPPRESAVIGLALVARYTSKGWPAAALVFLWLALRQAGGAPAQRKA